MFVVKYVTAGKLQLKGRHVICSSEYEGVVREVARSVRGHDHVRVKTCQSLAEACRLFDPARDLEPSLMMETRNTFVNARTAPSESPTTASTTDANETKGKNPRAVALRGASEFWH